MYHCFTRLYLYCSYGQFEQTLAFQTVSDWNENAVSAIQDAYDNSVHTSLCYETSDKAYEVTVVKSSMLSV